MSKKIKCYRFLFEFILKQRGKFLLLVLSSLLWAAANSGIPYFIKSALDDISSVQASVFTFQEMFYPCFLFFVCCLFLEIGLRYQGYVFLKIFPELQAQVMNFIISQLRSKDYHFFEKVPIGQITTKLVEMPKSCEMLLTLLICNFSSSIVSIMLSIAITLTAHYIFTVILLSWYILHISISIIFSKKANSVSLEYSIAHTQVQGKVADMLRNIDSVWHGKAFSFEQEYIKKYQKKWIDRSTRSLVFLEKIKALQGAISLLMISVNSFLILFYWKKEIISFGDASLLFLLMFGIISLSWYMSQSISIYFREMSKLKSALLLLDSFGEGEDTKKKKPLAANIFQNRKKVVDIKNISYVNNCGKRLFNDLSLSIFQGEKVAIVGESGIGKSTLINIILQIYQPSFGSVMIDESIHNEIIYLPQKQLLFNRTIAENIAYGNVSHAKLDMINACSVAEARQFIEALPRKYHTKVGEGGVQLSGGQVQRILLARAIYKDAPFYILDEPLSAIDSETEIKIYRSLFEYFSDRTVVIITHSSAIRDYVDKLYYLSSDQLRLEDK